MHGRHRNVHAHMRTSGRGNKKSYPLLFGVSLFWASGSYARVL